MSITYDNTLIKNKYTNSDDIQENFSGLSYCINSDLTKYSNTLMKSDIFATLNQISENKYAYSVKLHSVNDKNVNILGFRETTSSVVAANTIVSFTPNYFYNNTNTLYEILDYDTTDFVFTTNFQVLEKGEDGAYSGTYVNKEYFELQDDDIIYSAGLDSWSIDNTTGKYIKQNQIMLGKYALEGFCYGNQLLTPRSLSYNPTNSSFSGTIAAFNNGIPYGTYSLHSNTTKYRNCYGYYTDIFSDNYTNDDRYVYETDNYVTISVQDSSTSRTIKQYKKAKLILKHLASYGLYFVPRSIRSTITKNDLINVTDDNIWLGYMTTNRRTTGEFIKGNYILSSDTINKKGQLSNIPYKGVIEYKDNIDNSGFMVYGSSNAGLMTEYALTYAQLMELNQVINGNPKSGYEPPENFSFKENIINVFTMPFAWNSNNYHITTINNHVKIAGFDTGVDSVQLTGGYNGYVDLATFTINRPHNNFLDYKPYTQITIHVPFFGDFEIENELCYNTTITVRMCYTAITGDFRLLLLTTDNIIIGDTTKNLSIDMPLSENGYYTKKAAVISSEMSALKGVVGATTSAISGNVTNAVMQGVNVASAIVNAKNTENANITNVIGNATGALTYNDNSYISYTIITPFEFDTSNFSHAHGYACMESNKLSNLHGFTLCENVDCTGITATSSEINMIKNYLETGVYL